MKFDYNGTVGRRRGIVLILVALFIVGLFAMAAFAVDLGVIAVVKTEMQGAADSAALAAVQELVDRNMLKGTHVATAGMSAARDRAIEYAAFHQAGGVVLVLDRNDANAMDGDIVLGHVADPTSGNPTLSTTNWPYNAAQVRIHRNNIRNGPLDLFFAPLIGTISSSLTVTALATIEQDITGFSIRDTTPSTSKLVPLAVDYNDFIVAAGGGGQDNYVFDKDTQTVSAGSDGIHEVVGVFPNNTAPGNFGFIDIGGNSSTPDVRRQLTDGPNESDFSYYPDGEFKLDSNGQITTNGTPGIKQGVDNALQSTVGKPRVFPLFDLVTDNGNNTVYRIVAFGGAVVTYYNGNGNNSELTIQPEFVIDRTGLGGGPGGSSKFVLRAMLLAQ